MLLKFVQKENKMKYKGKELDVFKSNENIAFNPPHQMLIWNRGSAEPLVEYVAAFCPSRENAVIINGGGVYQHCAEIPKGKTNWDIYQERYGATMKSLKEAIESFNASHIPCEFCPARGHCASDVRSVECTETFAEWAETEAKDETAGNV